MRPFVDLVLLGIFLVTIWFPKHQWISVTSLLTALGLNTLDRSALSKEVNRLKKQVGMPTIEQNSLSSPEKLDADKKQGDGDKESLEVRLGTLELEQKALKSISIPITEPDGITSLNEQIKSNATLILKLKSESENHKLNAQILVENKNRIASLYNKIDSFSESISELKAEGKSNKAKLENLVKIERAITNIREQIESLSVSSSKLKSDSKGIKLNAQGLIKHENRITNLYKQIEPLAASMTRLSSESGNHKTSIHKLDKRLVINEQETASVCEQILPLLKLKSMPGELKQCLERLVANENIIENLRVNTEEKFESQRLLQEIKDLISSIRPYDYSLVLNAEKSRECLEEALEFCERKLILVMPWLRKKIFYSSINKFKNRNLKYLFDEAQKRGVKIHIGCGHLQDTYKNIKLNIDEPIELKYFLDNLDNADKREMYSALEASWFQVWRNRDKLELKLMGTHQKYLICDEKFAMIGSHNFLSSGSDKPDLELGLRTTDPEIIQDLISQFEKGHNYLKTETVEIFK